MCKILGYRNYFDSFCFIEFLFFLDWREGSGNKSILLIVNYWSYKWFLVKRFIEVVRRIYKMLRMKIKNERIWEDNLLLGGNKENFKVKVR